MDVSINGTSFTGKREVVYALKSAAREAKHAEMHRASSFGPRPIDKSMERKVRMESLQAYMDMAVYDDGFEKAIKELPNENDGLELKKSLMPSKLQWGEINPLELFKNSLTVNCMVQKKHISTDVINKFLKFLQG